MRWGVLLIGYAVLIVVDINTWLRGCQEMPDCTGIPLVAFYALLPLIAIWLTLAVVLLVARVRRRRRSRKSSL